MSKSSWKKKIEKQWGPHKHCPICGKAMPPHSKFCSQECKDNYLSDQKSSKKKNRIQCVFLIGMMIVMFVVMFFFL
jgi:predicted nucleic acid-binding Zn ribbon protein